LVGVALSMLLFTARASKLEMRELIVTSEGLIRERGRAEERAESLLIYDIEGELFFGAAQEFQRYLDTVLEESESNKSNYVVLRLKRTRNPDLVVIEHLERFLRDAKGRGTTVLLAGIRPDLLAIFENVRLTEWFPADQIFPEEQETFSATLRAVRRANELANRDARSDEGIEPSYYLV
jgi:SulP family sulfate permease